MGKICVTRGYSQVQDAYATHIRRSSESHKTLLQSENSADGVKMKLTYNGGVFLTSVNGLCIRRPTRSYAIFRAGD